MQPAVRELVSSLVGPVNTYPSIIPEVPKKIRIIARPQNVTPPVRHLFDGIAMATIPEPKRKAKGKRTIIGLKDIPAEQLESLNAQAHDHLLESVHDDLVLQLAIKKLHQCSEGDPAKLAELVAIKLFSESGRRPRSGCKLLRDNLSPDKWLEVRERFSDFDPTKIVLTRAMVNELVIEESAANAAKLFKEINRLAAQLNQALGKRVMISYSIEPTGRPAMFPFMGLGLPFGG